MKHDATTSTLWHPFTQHGLETTMLPIASASGAWLETVDGKPIYDAVSSWWVITHGHCHPAITTAIAEQATKLDQVIFAGFTHEPAETLARDLIAVLPAGLTHVFLSDSGSTAAEVALKMALGYWRNRGDTKRTRLIAMDHAYHGDTVGTMSVGARSVFNAAYEPMLFDVTRVPYPAVGKEQQTIDALEAACKSGDVAAFICEPLILGSGGMLVYAPQTLRELKAICERHAVLFIADEVMTGFGRTGRMFACEQAGITPDIICLAKGITGGSIPLAATACRAEIFEAHRSDDRARMFFHSSSYTANPLACAAAVANLKIWRDEPVLDRLKTIAAIQREKLSNLTSTGLIENPRQIGTVTAFDIAPKTTTEDIGYLSNAALALRKAAIARGVLFRPLGLTGYVMPPYCSTAADFDIAYDTIAGVISEWRR